MKKALLILLLSLFAATSVVSAQKQTKAEKKAEKEAALIKELDSLITNRRFDFIAKAYESNYGGISRQARDGKIEFTPSYTNFSIKGFNADRITPAGYVVVKTEKGWLAVFSAKAMGLSGDRDYDGEFSTFRFELSVDHKGNAVLKVTTDFNNHKYPHVYRGYINKNR